MEKPVLELQQFSLMMNGTTLWPPLSMRLPRGALMGITGPSGCGKTALARAMAGKAKFSGVMLTEPSDARVTLVEQLHHFKNKSQTTDLYYQQRYNSCDAEDSITAAEFTGPLSESGNQIAATLQMETVFPKPLVQLSNGEHKKVQLLKALQHPPDILILDQPFIGLDRTSRSHLHTLLEQMKSEGATIMVICPPREWTPAVTHGLWLCNGEAPQLHAGADLQNTLTNGHTAPDKRQVNPRTEPASTPDDVEAEVLIRLKNVSIAYGNHAILKDISWEVREGEQWLLHGPNGAGKSTLLSLITGDNPQAYAHHVELFGQRRGSGESIWDIKKKMGFVSPELHLFFPPSATCFETVASGLFDTMGLFRPVTAEKACKVDNWLRQVGMEAWKHRSLSVLPAGKQRMLMLARALIKDPPLLILDEPCQGLDEQQTREILQLIEITCNLPKRTLIFVTHYSNEIPGGINRKLFLKGGRQA